MPSVWENGKNGSIGEQIKGSTVCSGFDIVALPFRTLEKGVLQPVCNN